MTLSVKLLSVALLPLVIASCAPIATDSKSTETTVTVSQGKVVGKSTKTVAAKPAPAKPDKPTLDPGWKLVNEGTAEYPIYYVNGMISNNTGKKFSYVQVSFKALDASNVNIGTCWSNGNDLAPGEKMKVHAICTDDSVVKVTSPEISAF